MAEKSSPNTTLAAQEGIGSITMCDCGVVSLNMGGVTIRLEITAFSRLETMIREAAEELGIRATLIKKMRQASPSTMTH
jgi:8-oxo-dGTP pyrophosphatase MutT (NUDIX family)